VITVPGSDDIMLNYQSLSHHDAIFCRETLKRPPAPEFDRWLREVGLVDQGGALIAAPAVLVDYLSQSKLVGG
jgi:ethanolamine ammonia-lyase large subunit